MRLPTVHSLARSVFAFAICSAGRIVGVLVAPKEGARSWQRSRRARTFWISPPSTQQLHTCGTDDFFVIEVVS